MAKTVSVIVTTYNGEAHLREQLDSLVAQSYPLYEVVIQDDNSTDGTWTILQEYAERYPFVKVYRNESTHGVNGNLYSAMRRATGELLAICDQDDIWEPQKIAEQVEKLGDNLLIAGQTIPFSTDGTEVSFDRRTPNCHVLRLLFASAVPGHSMLLRPELLERYSPNDVNCYDSHLQVVATALEKFCYQGICPVHQRRHATATTYTKPVNNSRGAVNMLSYLVSCARIYNKVYPVMEQRMQAWSRLLASIKGDTESLRQARTMTSLMLQRGFLAKIRLAKFCYKHRNHLFYTVESDSIVLRLRALLFPLTAVYYFRTMRLQQP